MFAGSPGRWLPRGASAKGGSMEQRTAWRADIDPLSCRKAFQSNGYRRWYWKKHYSDL